MTQCSGSNKSRDFVRPPGDRQTDGHCPEGAGRCASGHPGSSEGRGRAPHLTVEAQRGEVTRPRSRRAPRGSWPSLSCARGGEKMGCTKDQQRGDSPKLSSRFKNCPSSETSPVPTRSPTSQIKLFESRRSNCFLIFSEASCQGLMLMFCERQARRNKCKINAICLREKTRNSRHQRGLTPAAWGLTGSVGTEERTDPFLLEGKPLLMVKTQNDRASRPLLSDLPVSHPQPTGRFTTQMSHFAAG